MGNLIEIKQLSFKRDEQVIFERINIQIPRGKIIAIMGPSGSGKTTLLRLIGAQLSPDHGSILINGHNIHNMSQAKLYEARKKMGLLFQSSALFTNLTVFENVAFPIVEHSNLPKNMVRDIVLMKLEAVGLRGAADLMPAQLSGGMARRVALARAIALDPELIMYDEPFTGQDPISMAVLVKLIKTLNQVLDLTSIVVSHDVDETCSIADYIYIVSRGTVLASGTPQELKESSQADIRQFMHGLPDGVVPFHYPAKDYSEELLND